MRSGPLCPLNRGKRKPQTLSRHPVTAKRQTVTAPANGERRTPNGERQTAERRTANGERRTVNGERRTPNAKRRTPKRSRQPRFKRGKAGRFACHLPMRHVLTIHTGAALRSHLLGGCESAISVHVHRWRSQCQSAGLPPQEKYDLGWHTR